MTGVQTCALPIYGSQEVELGLVPMQSYLDTCTDNPCNIPIQIHSGSLGPLTISNLEVEYTNNPVDIQIDVGSDGDRKSVV